VLPIADAEVPSAAALARQAVDQGLRAEVAEPAEGTLGARVRAARLVPYQAIVGSREAAAGRVALRLRDGRRLDALPAAEALARIGAMVGARRVELWDGDAGPERPGAPLTAPSRAAR
jgi:threonyl-tRNA synthetase